MAQLGRIFICYRHDDSAGDTDRIWDRLSRAFGRQNLFRDIDSIPTGRDFRKEVLQTLQSCRAVLAVIGREWIRDVQGRRRLDSAEDHVRIEIETALAREGLPIIPVLVRNVQMPAPEELPDSLKDLVYRHAALVRPAPDFDTDIKRLIRSLRRVLEASEAEAGEVRGEDAANLSGATASPEASDGLSVTKERPFKFQNKIGKAPPDGEPPQSLPIETKFAMNEVRKILTKFIPAFETRYGLNLQEKVMSEAAREAAFKIKPARALVFGHTGVGKTTTINRLLTSNIFPTTGQLSCTKSLAVGQHPDGLIFYDSPGIGDEPEQENITRVALGIPQRNDQLVSKIRLLDITTQGQEGPEDCRKLTYEAFKTEVVDPSFFKRNKEKILGKEFALADFKKWISAHPFDFVVFVMSSEKGLPSSDVTLIQDLYRAQKNKDIKLFKVHNIFHGSTNQMLGSPTRESKPNLTRQ